MSTPEPLSLRSPNRPNPTPSSILKKTIPAPGTIRKIQHTRLASSISTPRPASPPKASTQGGSPTRQWASKSMYSPTRTPRPASVIEHKVEAPNTVVRNTNTVRNNTVPNTIQRVQKIFDPNIQTPIRSTTQQQTTNDLLISFETPTSASTATAPASSALLDLNDLLAPTPNMTRHSHESLSLEDSRITELLTTTLDSERAKWQEEAEMRRVAELESLAADLHSQYREKHTKKVEALKVTYKRQYEKKVGSLEEKVKELEGIVEELKKELEKERTEKQELIEMSEELMRLTSAGSGEGNVKPKLDENSLGEGDIEAEQWD